MKVKIRTFGLMVAITIVVFCSGILYAQGEKDWFDDPKYDRLLDLAECSLKVEQVEKTDSIMTTDRTKLAAGRNDVQLLLIQLKGVAPDYGKISVSPGLFGINYIFKNKLTFSPAKAVGVRGKSVDGKDVELWGNKSDDSGNYVMEKQGSEINFWIAVEVPRKVEEFYIRIPSQIDNPVKNIK